MASQTDIANIALQSIGASTITAFTDGTKNANKVSQLYEHYRDALLRAYHWKFATKRKKLARSSNTPVFEFDYQYPLPNDYVRLIAVYDNDAGLGSVRYKLGYDEDDTKVIWCSSDEVWITYVANITSVQNFDPTFRMALAYKLAVTLAVSIAESRSLSDDMRRDYKDTIRQARSYGALEDYPEQFPDGSWSDVRNSSFDRSTPGW